MTDYSQQICIRFLGEWKEHPTATLHWVVPKDDEGFWVMRNIAGEKVMDKIPHWVGDYVWRKLKLAEDVYPDPHARDCIWHLILKP